MSESRTKINSSTNINNNTTSTFTSSILNNIVFGAHSSATTPDRTTEEVSRTALTNSLYNKIDNSARKQTNIRRQHNNFATHCRTVRSPNSSNSSPAIAVTAAALSPTSRSLTEFLQTISDQPEQIRPSSATEVNISPAYGQLNAANNNNSRTAMGGSLTALLPLSTQRSARRFWRVYLHRLARLDVCIVLLLILLANVAIFSLIFVGGKNGNPHLNLGGAGSVLMPVMPPLSRTAMESPALQAAASETVNNSEKDDDEEEGNELEEENVLPMPKTFDDFETLLTSLELDHDVPVNKIVSLLKTTVKGGEAERNMLEGFMSGVKCMRSLSTGAKCEKPDFFQQIHDAIKSDSSTSSSNSNLSEQSSVFTKASNDFLHNLNIDNNQNSSIHNNVVDSSGEKQKFEQFKSVWLVDMGPILLKQFSSINMTEARVRALLAGLDAQMLKQYVVPFLPTDRETLSRMVTTLGSLVGTTLPMPDSILNDTVDLVQHVVVHMKQGYTSLFPTLVQTKLEQWMISGECWKISRILRYFTQALPAGYGNKMWATAKHIGLQPLMESFVDNPSAAASDDEGGGRAAHDQLLRRLRDNMTRYDASLVETQWISSGGWDACLLRPLAKAGIYLFGTEKRTTTNWDDIDEKLNNITPDEVSRYVNTDLSASHPGGAYAHATLNYTYTIPNSQFCIKHPADILIMVFTHIDNRRWRDAVRKTFGKLSSSETDQQNRFSHSVIFVVDSGGEQQSNNIDSMDEQTQFGDIMQLNLGSDNADGDAKQQVHKVLAATQWFSLNCLRQKYLMKVEQNVFVRPSSLIDVLSKPQSPNDPYKSAFELVGKVRTNAIPMRLPFLPSFVPVDVYSVDKFPSYLDDSAYVLHSAVIPELLRAAVQVPLLPGGAAAEFITGIVRVKASAKTVLVHSAGFAEPDMLSYRPDRCRTKSNAVIFRNVLPQDALAIWNCVGTGISEE